MSATNPYANNPQLTPLEAEVLWEYAKLADNIKRMTTLAREQAENPNELLLANFRDLEKRMKLVWTSYRAAVFGVITQNMMEEEAQTMAHLAASGSASASGSAYSSRSASVAGGASAGGSRRGSRDEYTAWEGDETTIRQ